ncbi:putative leucine-rich repeat domain, L domain-containing protein [Medicago truncatula]|uniref:Putative leucine-rich repeat domain, L domain-containing protein n=1 Tax=Medicago truncatula TaxID=3880 RepID=A0A396HIE7_MEDTR|nr:putative leucine-rich repeat domain, L domain-containing protein [Medicago truncatula]
MKRKKRTSLKSSQKIINEETYLPDECWESIFEFLIIKEDRCCLNSLSLVSKQFLSITNCLLFSLTIIENPTRLLLGRLFRRFTNLISLDLSQFNHDVNHLLRKISRYPLKKLTSLCISSNQFPFPTNGLRAFSESITTLTSLTCTHMFLYNNELLLNIADCFPLLKELNLAYPLDHNQIHYPAFLLSKFRCIQHLTLESTFFLNDQQIEELSLLHSDLVSINLNDCWKLTELSLFSLRLDLNRCYYISNAICQVLRCCKITHLNLTRCSIVNLLGINFLVPKLEVLDLSYTKVDDEQLFVISKNCCGLLQLLLKNCANITEKGVKHVVENCKQLKEIYLGDIHSSDKTRKLCLRHGCLLC